MNDPGRKFYLSVLLIVIFGVFVFLDKMTTDQFSDSVIWVLAIFSGANVAQKFSPVVPATQLRKQV